MNIMFLVSSLNYGGAEKQTVLDANLLSNEHNVILCCYKTGPLEKKVDNKVKFILIKKNTYLSSAYRLSKIIRKNKVDIIHSSLFSSIIIAALSSVIIKVKVIWQLHSHEYDIPAKSRIAYRYLSKLPGVKRILFVSHELKQHYNTFHFPKQKLGILYNHSELEVPGRGNRNFKDHVHIGYVGRVIDLKRVDYLVSLANFLINKKRFSSFIIHIVGDGEALHDVVVKVNTEKLEGVFNFHGFQNNVKGYYNEFDFFVNPSSEECLSISMIDAGMMGLPIVAFDVGGNNEIVINNKTGYIVHNIEDFYERCFELISDPQKRFDFGKAANEHCKLNFGKDKHVENLRNLYHDILYED